MAMMPCGDKRLEKLDVLLLVAIILIFQRRAGLCNAQMAVFRWSVIAVNQALSVANANQRSNLLPVNMDIDGLFELDSTRLRQLRCALQRLAKPGCQWVSFAFFTENELACLTRLAERQKFRSARPEVTFKANSVLQDFDICFPAPRIDAFDRFADCLETGLYKAGQMITPSPFLTAFRFNDFAIQRYAPGSQGIGVHRDGERYKHIVVIATLAGDSRLFVTGSRDGTQRRMINDRPGRIVLLSAPSFAGRRGKVARPLHGVDHVHGGRLSLGLRIQKL
jgi:hypothetical protein